MRDIEFRAKRTLDNQWVFGNLVTGLDNVAWASILRKADADQGQPFEEQEVDPETVGQYTGKNDVNNTPIYEGDIVVINTVDNCGNINGFKGLVVFHDCNFELLELDTDTEVFEGLCYYNEQDFEIIGNIHDNPEFMEV